MLGLVSCRGGRFADSFDVFFVDVPMRLSPGFVFRWDPLWFVFVVFCPVFLVPFRSDLVCCDCVGRLVPLGVVVGIVMGCESPLSLDDDAWPCGTVDWDIVARASPVSMVALSTCVVRAYLDVASRLCGVPTW